MENDRIEAKRREPRREGPGRSVALYVDYENLQRSSLACYRKGMDPLQLGPLLHDLAGSEGTVQVSRAYADWTVHPEEARAFRRIQIEPILAFSKENGDSRSGVELSLDVYENLHQHPEVDTYIVVSGNSDLYPLLRRLREAGRRIVVAGIREATGRELVQIAERVQWIDEDVDWEEMEPDEVDLEAYDWGPFVRLLDSLEKNLEFIGLNYLIRRVLDRNNCGFSDLRHKQDIVNAAQSMGLIDVYQVENKDEGGDPVSACKLDPNHPLVDQHLAPPEDEEYEEAEY